MNGRLVPAEYFSLRPWYLNFFENPVAVQFNHRMLAVCTLAAVLMLQISCRKMRLPVTARAGIRAMGFAVVLQVSLGIATLLSGAPVLLSAAHQVGAVLLLTSSLVALRGLTPVTQREGLYFALHRRGVAPRA
jgi:cytochrome c oxidase assembly protein subunit 15